MNADLHNPNNPVYMSDLPKDPEICRCCQENEATDFWLTMSGRMYVCGGCIDFHISEDNKFLIEKIK